MPDVQWTLQRWAFDQCKEVSLYVLTEGIWLKCLGISWIEIFTHFDISIICLLIVYWFISPNCHTLFLYLLYYFVSLAWWKFHMNVLAPVKRTQIFLSSPSGKQINIRKNISTVLDVQGDILKKKTETGSFSM